MDIQKMAAGGELDILIAKKVLNLEHPGEYRGVRFRFKDGTEEDEWFAPWMLEKGLWNGGEVIKDYNNPCYRYWDNGETAYLPDCSTEIAHAWWLVEHLRLIGVGLVIKAFPKGRGFHYDYVVHDPDTGVQAVSTAAPHAICLAALMAKEAKEAKAT